MASIGLKDYRWAELNADNKTYKVEDGLKKLEGAIECTPKFNFNEGQLKADDRTIEDVSEFSYGDLTMGVADDNDEAFDEILGRTRSSEGEVVSNVNDAPKYVGFSDIITKIKNGKKIYKVEFLPKVKFKPFVTGAKTKGDSLEFTTPSVEGKFYENADGNYEIHKEFEIYEEAVSYQNSLFGYTPSQENQNANLNEQEQELN